MPPVSQQRTTHRHKNPTSPLPAFRTPAAELRSSRNFREAPLIVSYSLYHLFVSHRKRSSQSPVLLYCTISKPMSPLSTFTFTFSFPAPRPQPMPFRRTGAIFIFSTEAAVDSKRHAMSCLPRSTKRRKIGVLKRSKSSRRPSPLQPTLASTITSTPPAHATMAIRARSAVAGLLQAAKGLVTAKARCEKEGLEDLQEYVNSLSPTRDAVREVEREGLQEAEKGNAGNRMDEMMEVWEWGSKSGFRWSDRELRGCVRMVSILETIWEEEDEGW